MTKTSSLECAFYATTHNLCTNGHLIIQEHSSLHLPLSCSHNQQSLFFGGTHKLYRNKKEKVTNGSSSNSRNSFLWSVFTINSFSKSSCWWPLTWAWGELGSLLVLVGMWGWYTWLRRIWLYPVWNPSHQRWGEMSPCYFRMQEIVKRNRCTRKSRQAEQAISSHCFLVWEEGGGWPVSSFILSKGVAKITELSQQGAAR